MHTMTLTLIAPPTHTTVGPVGTQVSVQCLLDTEDEAEEMGKRAGELALAFLAGYTSIVDDDGTS